VLVALEAMEADNEERLSQLETQKSVLAGTPCSVRSTRASCAVLQVTEWSNTSIAR
jgi:hypothetical protein